MSKSIDNRIVEMQFNNAQFENGVKKSLNSLENLDKTLNTLGKNTAFEDVDRSVKKVSFESLLAAVETVSNRFSALGIIGVTALQNITNKAIDLGGQLVKSLTVDQLASGWTKYEQKTASVQTLLNSTGASIDEVNSYLEKLMWFSDETSYGFTDMTSALAQMTSSGGDIKKLIPMIEGVANSVAFAGKGASEFSRVMYNINQSYSGGFMNYMDWKSIDLAGASSKELKQAFIDTAKALGQLDAEGKTANGTLVTISNFGQTLSEKWANTDVMEKAFSAFAEMSEKAYEMVRAGEVDTASEAYAKLAEEYDNVYLAAARSAQEAKTFREAIEATKDAVSSGWMETYEKIFGNYKEATKLWTDFAEDLWDVFASGGEKRNDILSEWIDNRGRTIFIKGLYNSMTALKTVIESVSKAFSNIFPSITADQLKRLSVQFKQFTKKLILMEDEANQLTRALSGLFAIVDIFGLAFDSVLRIIGLFSPEFSKLSEGFLDGAASLGDLIVGLRDYLKENDSFYEGLKKVVDFVAPAFETIKAVIDKLIDSLKELTGIDHIPTFEEVSTVASNIRNNLDPILKMFSSFKDGIQTVFTALKDAFSSAFSKDGLFGNLNIGKTAGIAGILLIFKELWEAGGLIQGVKKLFDKVDGIGKTISGIFSGITDAIDNFSKRIQSDTLLKIAFSLGVMAISLSLIAAIDSDKLLSAVGALAGLSAIMLAMLKVFGLITKGGFDKSIRTVANTLLVLSVALLIASAAVRNFSKMNWNELSRGFTGFAGALVVMVGALWLMKKLKLERMLGVAATLNILAVGLVILAVALKIFVSNDLKSIGRGLLAMAISLGILVGGLALLNKIKPGTLLAAGFALTILSVGMIALAVAVKIFSSNDLSSAAIGVGSMAISLYALVGSLAFLQNIGVANLLAAGFALTILSVGMIALAVAVKIFSSNDLTSTAIGLGAMVIALYSLVGALILLQKANPIQMITIAGSILILSAAMVVLSVAVIAMGSAGMDVAATGLITIAAALAVFGVAGYLITPQISTNLMLLAVALAMLGASFLIITPSLKTLGEISLDQVINGLVALAGTIGTFAAVAALLTPVEPAMVGLAGAMDLLAIAVWIVSDAIANASAGFSAFVNSTERLGNIKENLVGVGDSVRDAISAMSQSLTVSVTEFGNIGTDAANSFVEKLNTGLNSGSSTYKVTSAGKTLANAAITGVKSVNTSSAGAAIVQGIVTGINNNAYLARQAAAKLAQECANTINASLKINSPSKVTMKSGASIVEGLVLGMKKNQTSSYAMASNVALDTVRCLNDKIDNIDEYDFEIRPVLDMSMIDNQLNSISGRSIVATLDMSSVNPAMKNIKAIVGAKTARENAKINQNGSESGSTVWAPTFNQYNNSPKALSRAEIYRNTKNQFAQFSNMRKGVAT